MNVETGKVYVLPEDVEAALKRKEPLAQISERAAAIVSAGRAARLETIRKERKTFNADKRRKRRADKKRSKSSKARRIANKQRARQGH